MANRVDSNEVGKHINAAKPCSVSALYASMQGSMVMTTTAHACHEHTPPIPSPLARGVRLYLLSRAFVAALSALPVLLAVEEECHGRGFRASPHSLDQPRTRPSQPQPQGRRFSIVKRHSRKPDTYRALSDVTAAHDVATTRRETERHDRGPVPLEAEHVGALAKKRGRINKTRENIKLRPSVEKH